MWGDIARPGGPRDKPERLMGTHGPRRRGKVGKMKGLMRGPRGPRRASLIAQSVKNLPAMQETQVRFLDWEDPLEEEMATHSSNLAWKNPMNRGTWQATVHGVKKSWTLLSH